MLHLLKTAASSGLSSLLLLGSSFNHLRRRLLLEQLNLTRTQLFRCANLFEFVDDIDNLALGEPSVLAQFRGLADFSLETSASVIASNRRSLRALPRLIALGRDVARAIKEDGLGRLSVSSGAADFLIVGID